MALLKKLFKKEDLNGPLDKDGRLVWKYHEDLASSGTKESDFFSYTTNIFQLNNGLIFNHQHDSSSRHKLYVDYQGKRIIRELPTGKVKHVGRHGNTVYFESDRQIYKAFFVYPNSIKLTKVRDRYENESCYDGALCKIRRNRKKYVYRMCDDPVKDGIRVDVSSEDLNGLFLLGIFNGVAYYTPIHGSKVRQNPLAIKLCDNVIKVELPKYGFVEKNVCRTYSAASADELPARFYSSDLYAYSYFTNGSSLYAFDIETFSFLEPLMFRNVVWTIAGIHDGVITARGAWEDSRMTGELPMKYRKLNDVTVKVKSKTKTDGQNLNTLASNDDTVVSPKPMKDERHPKKLAADFEKEINPNVAGEQKGFKSNFLVNFVPRSILGEGGFGCVFEAVGILDKRIYAVKRIPIKGSGADKEDAIQEVRILSSLEHEGIVTYNSSWIESPPKGWQKKTDEALLKKLQHKSTVEYRADCSFIYIQMEFCDYSLADYIYLVKTRNMDLAQYWFYGLVAAVEYLHSKSIIHRDLKPNNILFNEKDMQLKICDFGLVANRVIKEGKEIDVTRTACGTPMYAAPEQFSSSSNSNKTQYTAKVDIFSLGLILMELCVFMSIENANELFDRYREGKPLNILHKYPEAAELVRLTTHVNPSKRLNCGTILQHPFFDSKTKPVERLLETSSSLLRIGAVVVVFTNVLILTEQLIPAERAPNFNNYGIGEQNDPMEC